MVKLKKPICIPSTRTDLRAWIKNFKEKAPPLGDKYGIVKLRMDNMVLLADALEGIWESQDKVRAYDKALGDVLKDGLDMNPSNPNAVLDIPTLTDMPVNPATIAVLFLGEFAKMVDEFSTSPVRTDADLISLGIIKEATGTVVPPLEQAGIKPRLKCTVKNGKVFLKITKGTGLNSLLSVIEVDREGKGVYKNLLTFGGQTFEEAAFLSEGELSAAWTYRVVFVNGQEQLGTYGYASIIITAADVAAPLGPTG